MRFTVTLALAVLLTACGGDIDRPPAPTAPRQTARILVVGDVMLGRGVAAAMAADPGEVFAGVRHLLDGADIAGANLESPLTTRPHVSWNENDLAADPATAATLAGAGFGLLSLPNNHSSDAGPGGVLDTIVAVAAAGMQTVGAGPDRASATAPVIMDVDGLKIGFLAFDATGVSTPATDHPGVSQWEEDDSPDAVRALRRTVDIVVVSVHGGTEYLPVTDPGMEAIARQLAEKGAHVVINNDRTALVDIALDHRPPAAHFDQTFLAAIFVGKGAFFIETGPGTAPVNRLAKEPGRTA